MAQMVSISYRAYRLELTKWAYHFQAQNFGGSDLTKWTVRLSLVRGPFEQIENTLGVYLQIMFKILLVTRIWKQNYCE